MKRTARIAALVGLGIVIGIALPRLAGVDLPGRWGRAVAAGRLSAREREAELRDRYG